MTKWAFSAVIVLVFSISLFWLNHAGKASRLYGKAYGIEDTSVHMLNSSKEVYSLWKSRGFKGRVVLHLGEYLHFLQVNTSDVFKGVERFPVKTASLLMKYERELGKDNFLRVAMQGNIAREIINVLPPDVFREKLKAVRGQGGVYLEGDKIITHFLGSKRTLTDHIPAVKEPVLLNIDASYFSYSDAETLLTELRKSGIRTEMMSLCLSEDNPDVTDREREKLKNFAGILSKKRLKFKIFYF